MKSLIVLCLLCATAIAYPSMSDEESNESEFINPMTRKGVPSVVEVDVGDSDEDSFFFPSFFRPVFVNPFPRIRFGGFPSMFPSSFFSGFTNIFNRTPEDAKVTNATSTTKIVDGHKITVNATTYEKNGGVYKYQVIEVTRVDEPKEETDEKPTDEVPTRTDAEDASSSLPTPVESSEDATVKNDNNSLDNEIHREEWMHNYRNGYNDHNYVDLSNDIRVNTIAASRLQPGPYTIPDDVEVFDVSLGRNEPVKYTDASPNYYDIPNEIPKYVQPSRTNINELPKFQHQIPNYLPPFYPNYIPPQFYNPTRHYSNRLAHYTPIPYDDQFLRLFGRFSPGMFNPSNPFWRYLF